MSLTPPSSHVSYKRAGVVVGDTLPEHVQGPVTRTTLALYAGGSHDHVPLHIDLDFVRAAGMDDVFVHGMLCMAHLGQAVGRWGGQHNLRQWNVRFTAITPVHATVHSFGEVVEVFEADGERRARLKIGTRTGEGVQTLDGEAIVAFA
jgi:acyl dehydratase